jgi:glycyl-tRNA synthetase alpha subunit
VERRLCAAVAPAQGRPLRRKPEPAAALLPVPGDPEALPSNLQELYLGSLAAIGIDPLLHDIRFVEDDWESPTLGAWGLGWECWCDGMEVAVHLFPAGLRHRMRSRLRRTDLWAVERLAMYVQGVDNVYDLNFNGREGAEKATYGDVFLQAEQEYSRYNFEIADTAMLLKHFEDAEKECEAILKAGAPATNPVHCTAACCRPTTSASRRPTSSTCSMRAA